MKIQIDTKAKTIKIDEQINLKELVDFVSKTIPDWKEYKLEMTVINNWSNPIIIERNRWWDYRPLTPYYGTPTYIQNQPTCCYNLEIK